MLPPAGRFTVDSSQSVQAVIDAAPDNSVIFLRPGIYRERLVIDGKRIQLVAEQAPTFSARATSLPPGFSVVFDGAGASPARNGAPALIQFLNTRRFEANGDSFSSMLSGIELRNNGDLNFQGQSGGLTLFNSDVVVKNNYLHDLKSHDGAAISVQSNSRLNAVNNLIWNNEAKRWGAVFDTRSNAGTNYSSNSFKGNKSTEGNAFYQDFGTGFFINNIVQDGVSSAPNQGVDSVPRGESKGAIMLRKDATTSVIQNQFINNAVINSGLPHSGAINIETEGATNIILLNTFFGNRVEGSNDSGFYGKVGSGGAIGIFNRSKPAISFNAFLGNYAGFGGSAISASEQAVAAIQSNYFAGNLVGVGNGMSTSDSPRERAGAIFIEGTGSNGTSRLRSNYFFQNTAGQSPDLYLGDKSSADVIFNTFDLSSGEFLFRSGNSIYKYSSVGTSGGNVFLAKNAFSNAAAEAIDDHGGTAINIPFINKGGSFIGMQQNAFAGAWPFEPGSHILTTQPYLNGFFDWDDFIAQPIIASDQRVAGDSSADVEGYDRASSTFTGAYETMRQSSTQEMNITVWRFRKGYGALAHFYTASAEEKDGLIKISQDQANSGKPVDWIFEGAATNYNVSLDPLINYGIEASDTVLNGIQDVLSPVYRFFNPLSGTHLYTMDPNERDSVLTDLPHYRFEGIAYYALPNSLGAPPPGGASLQRFFNTTSNSHFYTADPIEFQQVYNTQNALGFKYDGLAFIPGMNSAPTPSNWQ